MTTIAFDGKTLAADCMGDNAGIKRRVVKIERFGDALLAMTGAQDSAVELREWFKGGGLRCSSQAMLWVQTLASRASCGSGNLMSPLSMALAQSCGSSTRAAAGTGLRFRPWP